MATKKVIGFSGNITRPSRTAILVDHIAAQIASRVDATHRTYDIEDLGSSLASARNADQLSTPAAAIVRNILDADILVVGSPTYKGSYTGLFKHFFDLLEPAALRGKPVILAATGGGQRHALTVEHQLRPLFGFFEAFTLPTAIYASSEEMQESGFSAGLRLRIANAVEDAGRLSSLPVDRAILAAAE